MAKRKRLRRLLKALAVFAVVVGLGVGAALYVMARKDAEHAKFFETGRSVNIFLSGYTKAVKDGFAERDPAKVAALYSERFSSRARGRWALRPDADQSDIVVSRLAPDGAQDFTKADINTEVSGYFASLSSVQNIWTKIDMIEQVELGRRVTLRVKFILDGADAAGGVFQDRNFYRWTLVNEGTGGGRVQLEGRQGRVDRGRARRGDGDSFRDIAPPSVGIDFKHSRDPKLNADKYSAQMKFDIIEHGSGGASAADYDGDNRQDIFFPDGVRSPPLPERQRPIPARQIRGRDDRGRPRRSRPGERRNLRRRGQRRGRRPLRRALPRAEQVLPKQRRRKFTDQSTRNGARPRLDQRNCRAFSIMTVDGFVDLYVGLYGDALNDVPRLPFFAQNAKPNRLYHNEEGDAVSAT